MSSKNVPDPTALPPSSRRTPRRAWSLAARLTTWYAGSAFGLVLATTGFLYWASVRNLDREDDQVLGDRVRAIRAVIMNRPGDASAMRREVDEEWEAHERTRVHIRIMDGAGKVIAETPGMSGLLPSLTFPAPSEEPGKGTDIKSVKFPPASTKDASKSVKRKPFRVLVVRAIDGSAVSEPYVIQVAMDRSEKVKLLAEYRKNCFLVLGVSLLVCTIVGYQIARRGIRPIDNITNTAQRIRPTNLGERIIPNGLPSELLILADTFNQMLDRLEQSFDRLSQFSADIAHELRTPVNNLRGGIEVALTKPRTLEQYRDVLGSNLEECGRLARIIDSLLFLARGENPPKQTVKETFDVGVELATVCDFFEAVANEKGIKLTVAAPSGVHADLNRPLFQRAVCNLVANAVAHTPPGGSVTLTASGDGASTTVEVIDTGCGIPTDHLPHVFDRFYRVDQVRSSSTGSVGLGLAIVKSIVALHGGTVHIASQVASGTCVTISFPRQMTKP